MTMTATADSSRPAKANQTFRTQALAPLFLGFAAPLLVVVFLDHPIVSEARGLFVLLLCAMLAVVGVLFLIAVFAPRTLNGIAMDETRSSVILTYSNILSDEARPIPLKRIRRIEQLAAYDQDGYPRGAGEIIMRNGERITLPFAPPADCVGNFRS
ncbi:MAG: hypothetical protein AAFY64_05385 [Pseudomonadota bacterium]